MFWCRDIGLAKRLLGYSVWLLGSGLAASNHDTPKASCQYEWYKPTPTPLWHSEWKIFLCEFWLLRCSTMVARAWPVSVEVIQDWLLAARVKRAHPHVSMTLLSWDIPLISFNGSLWDVLLRCSKWLLGAWLDSFTMILRCWLVVWIKWARPLVSMTLWSRVMFNWKAVSSQWGNFGTLLPPRGASFTPLCGMFLQSPSASSNVANFTFLRNPLSELWVCEFWLLRWSTMVARAWPVCVEVIQDWLLAAPSQTSPPSCFYDTSILRYPFDLFQWKSMGRVAKVL